MMEEHNIDWKVSEANKEVMRKLAICALDENNKIIAHTEPLAAGWTDEIEDAMKENFGVSIENEIYKIMTEEIKRNLTFEDIKKLFDKENINDC